LAIRYPHFKKKPCPLGPLFIASIHFFFRLIQVWQAWNSQQTGETPAHLFGVSMIQYPILVKNTYKLGSLLFGLLGGPATA
jgi:hypothetical protein